MFTETSVSVSHNFIDQSFSEYLVLLNPYSSKVTATDLKLQALDCLKNDIF